VVLDHVTQRTHRVVEGAPVLDAEVLGQGDLHSGHMLAIPHRLEQRIGESEEMDVQHRLLAQEVVDAQDLVLGEHLVQLGVEGPCGGQVTAEGLLDHHPAVFGQTGSAKSRHHRSEERGRDLQVEQRPGEGVQPNGQLLVGGLVGEVALQIAEPPGQTMERHLVHHVLVCRHGFAHHGAQVVLGPVVHRHADDRAVQPARHLQAIQRAKRHLARQVPGDPEDHQRVGRRGCGPAHVRPGVARIQAKLAFWSMVNKPDTGFWVDCGRTLYGGSTARAAVGDQGSGPVPPAPDLRRATCRCHSCQLEEDVLNGPSAGYGRFR